VKAVVVMLSGFATMLAGAFMRLCSQDVPLEFAQSWCGNAPLSGLVSASHAHCVGCALLATGLVLIAATPLLVNFAGRQATSQVRL
jgi:hypothetical protein